MTITKPDCCPSCKASPDLEVHERCRCHPPDDFEEVLDKVDRQVGGAARTTATAGETVYIEAPEPFDPVHAVSQSAILAAYDLYEMPEDVPEQLRQPLCFLRQWLNEDRITDPKKMVTNTQLWNWLKEGVGIDTQ